MMMQTVVIEWRNPRTKSESECWGETVFEGNIAKVFINARKNKNEIESADTFFHEMAHVFFDFNDKKLSNRKEEYLATKTGKIVAQLLK